MVAHTRSASCVMLQFDVALVEHSVKGSCVLALGGLALRCTMLLPSLLVRVTCYTYWESNGKIHEKAQHR